MAPEYGATIGFFPIDSETLNYLKLTGREPSHIELVETYAKAQGLFRTETTADPIFNDTLELDLTSVEPSLAGPRRPQDRVPLKKAKQAFREAWPSMAANQTKNVSSVKVSDNGNQYSVGDGSVVIAAITSCTNTSNPAVMLAAGLLAKKAVEGGLSVEPWVKTSLAPGSRVVSEYLKKTGLQPFLDRLGFNLVGFGCTTCIGNSGPLDRGLEEALTANDLVGASVLSGNRNFEARIHQSVKANFLMSPPLVVAFAIAGRIDVDLTREPLGVVDGREVYLRDIWPSM